MLYPEKMKPERKEELFCRPTCEYRGTPFWAWNGKLEKETLLEQIEILKKMGMGGFHMHVRTGMDTPYLSDAFMEHIRTCIEKAKEEGMLAWLYDEDRWPSGTAGGQVTREHPEYASRNLLLTTKPYADGEKKESGKSEAGHGRGGIRQENGELLAFGSANPRTEECYDSGSFTTYYGQALAVVRAGKSGSTVISVTDGKQTKLIEIAVK